MWWITGGIGLLIAVIYGLIVWSELGKLPHREEER